VHTQPHSLFVCVCVSFARVHVRMHFTRVCICVRVQLCTRCLLLSRLVSCPGDICRQECLSFPSQAPLDPSLVLSVCQLSPNSFSFFGSFLVLEFSASPRAVFSSPPLFLYWTVQHRSGYSPRQHFLGGPPTLFHHRTLRKMVSPFVHARFHGELCRVCFCSGLIHHMPLHFRRQGCAFLATPAYHCQTASDWYTQEVRFTHHSNLALLGGQGFSQWSSNPASRFPLGWCSFTCQTL